jgi:hypothetical protein
MANKLFEEYWQLRMESATKRLEAIKQIVIKHNPSRGAAAENTLRELLREFLPARCEVGTGFIVSKDGATSQQLDIIVYDQAASSPLYRDGSLVVVSPDMVHLVIEVKSDLDKGAIQDAFKNIKTTKKLNKNIRALIFAFSGVKTQAVFSKHLEKRCPLRSGYKTQAGFDRAVARLPDKIYHFEKEWIVQRPAVVAGKIYAGYKSQQTLVRYLIDEVLFAAGVSNLRDYLVDVPLKNPAFQV